MWIGATDGGICAAATSDFASGLARTTGLVNAGSCAADEVRCRKMGDESRAEGQQGFHPEITGIGLDDEEHADKTENHGAPSANTDMFAKQWNGQRGNEQWSGKGNGSCEGNCKVVSESKGHRECNESYEGGLVSHRAFAPSAIRCP